MNQEDSVRLLFQRYAEEVGGYLPRRKRKDIQLEILSLLEDSLDDLSARRGQPADEAIAMEVLKTHGPPVELARAYQAEDNLMRPTTYQVFKPVAAFAGGLLLLQLLISLGLAINEPGVDWGGQVLEWIEDVFTVLGILFLSFALLERTTPANWLKWPFGILAKDWDPAGLKARMGKQAVNRRESWLEVFWLVVAIVLFGLFPQWVGIGGNLNGKWYFLPVLAESFSVYQPWVILYWLGRMVFLAALARQAYWDTRMRLVQLGLKAFGIGLLFAMLVGPPVIGLNSAYLAQHNAPKLMQDLVRSGGVVFTVFYIVVGANLVVHLALLAIQGYRLVRDRAALGSWEVPGVN